MTDARRRPAGRFLARVALCLAALYLMLRWFEYRQVFQPSRSLQSTGRELGRPMEEVSCETADGVPLSGWYFPADGGSPRGSWVWLLCHGNAGNISHRLPHAAVLLQTGAAVFLFDYRGYGRSQGHPSEEGTYLDAQAAHAWLVRRGHSPGRIVVLGESLGGAIGVELASRETVGGVVLVAAFTSVPELGAELFPWLPVRWLSTIRYPTIRTLPGLRVPVMIAHGPADTIVPFHHAQENFAAAPEPKRFWPIPGDHNDFLHGDVSRYLEGLNLFLADLERGEPARIPPR